MVIKEGFKMCFKAVMANLFIVAGILGEPITYIAKPKDHLEAYI